MTPTPTGQVIPTAAGRDLVLERVLPGSIDDGWASITESDRLARWFCTWTGEPQVGATLELTLVAEEGDAKSHAEILACEPPTHLAVSTTKAGDWLLESTLTPIDANHTRLRFVHHLDEKANSKEVGPGWEYYLDAAHRCHERQSHAGLQRLLAEPGLRVRRSDSRAYAAGQNQLTTSPHLRVFVVTSPTLPGSRLTKAFPPYEPSNERRPNRHSAGSADATQGEPPPSDRVLVLSGLAGCCPCAAARRNSRGNVSASDHPADVSTSSTPPAPTPSATPITPRQSGTPPPHHPRSSTERAG